MPTQRPGHALPFLLLAAFRALVDGLHERLAAQGHPDLQPAHGFALQAISRSGSISEIGTRLGVTKQAAHKTVGRLEALGYVQRQPSSTDRRRTVVALTERGSEALALSGCILDELRDEWAAQVGEHAMDAVEDALETFGARDELHGILGWLGS